jgi:membrane protein implicated in regulation of membrane protease activity
MRRGLFWLGVVLLVIGIGLLGASAVMSYMGLSPSFNLGDPTKFQFILVPFWLVGVVAAALGLIAILVARRMRAAVAGP